MKLVCDGRELFEAINLASNIAPNRSVRPVLQHVCLRAEKGRLAVLATDLEVSVQLDVLEVDVQEDGVCLLPAGRAQAVARELQKERPVIETRDGQTEVRGETSRFVIMGGDPVEFPELPPVPESEAVTVRAADLQRMVERTSFAASNEKQRYALNGVLVHIEGNNLNLVATDGKRLALTTHTLPAETDAAVQVIVPTKGLNLLPRLPFGPEDTIGLSLLDSHLYIRSNRLRLACRLVDGQFPPYRDVIPKTGELKAEMGLEAFEVAVRRSAILQTKESHAVNFHFQPNELELTSSVPDLGQTEIELPIQFSGSEPLQVGFNPAYILDALKVIEGETCTLDLTGPRSPAVLRDEGFTYVVMPMELN